MVILGYIVNLGPACNTCDHTRLCLKNHKTISEEEDLCRDLFGYRTPVKVLKPKGRRNRQWLPPHSVTLAPDTPGEPSVHWVLNPETTQESSSPEQPHCRGSRVTCSRPCQV